MLGTLLFIALSGCAADVDTGNDEVALDGPGTLLVSFSMEEDLIPSMEEDPVGEFLGSIFAEDDASAIGPADGAEALEDLAVSMDLSSGTTTETYTTAPLEPGIYWILGCLDVDGNDCEAADPITVPNENKFQVEADTEVSAAVFMSMLNPS